MSNRTPEIWKVVEHFKGLEGLYEVSTHGRIRNLKTNRILGGTTKKSGTAQGYQRYTVTLACGTIKYIEGHRIVGPEFIPNPEKKQTIDHADGDRANNRVENLRWATHKEQCANRDERFRRSLTMTEARKLRVEWADGKYRSKSQAAREYGINRSTVVRVLNGTAYRESPWARKEIRD